MKQNSTLGPIVVASFIVLIAAQVAVAQVDWTYGDPVVGPGDPGSWNDGRNLVGDVVFDGSDYHMYLIGGPGGNALDNSWSVGHWTWNDLTSEWDEDDCNPVLEPGAAGEWDAFSIGSLAVLYDGVMFKMWYGGADAFIGTGQGGYATNSDGDCDWEKHVVNPQPGLGPGAPGSWEENGTWPSTVLFDGSSYRMWYVGSEGDKWLGTWSIGHATSPDGMVWTRDPDPVLEGTEPWEDDNLYSPEVVPRGGGFAMWYSGLIYSQAEANIGFAMSPDGLQWGKWPGNPVLIPEPGIFSVDSMSVIFEGNMIHGWVTHGYDVTHVTSPFELVFFDTFETGDTAMWSNVVP